MNTGTDRRNELWRKELRQSMKAKDRAAIPRAKMPELDAEYRSHSYGEVNRGLTAEQAIVEARRCLDCLDPQCITGCPVGIDIPCFIKNIERGRVSEAMLVLKENSALPAVCGRVCPQEKQCESKCLHHKMKNEPVAIGYLERFAADHAVPDTDDGLRHATVKIAVAGSGPAGLSFAGSMCRLGYDVTVFEALHEIGGVLKYGIPEFRLPNTIVDREIEALRKSGVKFVTNCIVGKTISCEELYKQDFRGIFIATGAGLPNFMNIPGENLSGILSANEYLTRINLMAASRSEESDTPVFKSKSTAVIGGGNTAMDAVRTARRLGAEKAILIYRRSEGEMPARVEEIRHAKEEGITFMNLYNPICYTGDERGKVKSVTLQRMQLGEPDESGRRRPVEIAGETVTVEVDMAIVAIGVSPNPLIVNTLKGLSVGSRGTVVVDPTTHQTSLHGIFAGGDIVRGGATVILAMGDGRSAAAAMHGQLSRNDETFNSSKKQLNQPI
jgi:glutamate synthase (NADPH/NADH) small chain